MRVSTIVNVMNKYNYYKTSLERDKKELLEYRLFDTHYGVSGEKMSELENRIKQTEQNMSDLLNSDVEDLNGINIVG